MSAGRRFAVGSLILLGAILVLWPSAGRVGGVPAAGPEQERSDVGQPSSGLLRAAKAIPSLGSAHEGRQREPLSSAPPLGGVRGRVVDEEGAGVPGVAVLLLGPDDAGTEREREAGFILERLSSG